MATAGTCEGEADDRGVDDAMFDLGGDERRMHVRAYNHWVSLLRNRPYPSIADLDPANIADFGAHSVLLDFGSNPDDPRIAFLGGALREECGLDHGIERIADVPSRSLLSRLTDHYLQIIANQAPIGFEAEFIGTRGRTMMYRGILMPFSSDGQGIDFIYGVINWKEVADALTQAVLDGELGRAIRGATKSGVDAPVWADGPSAEVEAEAEAAPAGSLADRLAAARESAAQARATDVRSRAALYRALGRAHDFALAADGAPDDYARLLAAAGLVAQARAPMTPIAKLVFGVDHDKTRLAEYAAVLSHARRLAVPAGGLADFLGAFAGGVKAIVAAERDAKRATVRHKAAPRPAAERAVLARVVVEAGAAPGDTVLLIARAAADGALDIVGSVAGDAALIERALRKAA